MVSWARLGGTAGRAGVVMFLLSLVLSSRMLVLLVSGLLALTLMAAVESRTCLAAMASTIEVGLAGDFWVGWSVWLVSLVWLVGRVCLAGLLVLACWSLAGL